MRANGNSAALADEFIRGAKDNGGEVSEVVLKDKQIKDCLGCGACQRNGGQCVQKDDMTALYAQLKEADVIALASPVYFYTWTSLMKRMLDRTFAVEGLLQNKTFCLLSAGAAPEEKYMHTMIDSFTQYVDCFRAGGNVIGGYVFAYGTNKPGDAAHSDAAKQAYALAKKLLTEENV